ncbi:hypothetical protein [Actinomadura opuntiae]|uniref:hypothetical protein n=1 Tax=Actinomadura sp. OS1-43 TaxID=604315 RepID=UPI00255B0407|nr:hypothetical protein [Actinomadura sp. OS1-43]MDL4813614.1 hypothetical protein [Actinomadura sp. OS1-43]
MAGSAADRVGTALSCAAADDRLSGVLFLGMPPRTLVELARRFADGFGPLVVLGAGTADDGLWTAVDAARDGLRIVPGRLAGDRPAVAAVPDLARLSLAGRRAAVSALGADVAHVERHGLSLAWRPRARWLAACARADAARLPPHLLDRFPLRIDAAGLADGARGVPIRRPPAGLPVPELAEEAAARAVELAGPDAGPRTDLALARIARAIAALHGAGAATTADVDEAARLLGLLAAPGPGAASGRPAPADPVDSAGTPDAAGDGPPRLVTEPVGAVVPVTAEALDPAVAEPAGGGAPSGPSGGAARARPDDPLGDGERLPLRAPLAPGRGRRDTRGPSVGTVHATDLHDLAVVPTLLTAARFQAVRCPGHHDARPPHPLHLAPADLRAHRRAARPPLMVVLLLDHTAGADWPGVLAPYLHWMYTARATVGLIEVGTGDDELRARLLTTRNLLDPRVAAALERPPGRATPLAHGLLLAERLLRRELPAADAVLLVATDGRGNVPLSASHAGRIVPPVSTQGVDDALAVAERIRKLAVARSVVVDPGPRPQRFLTARLAEALGAELHPAGEPEW